MQAIGQVDLVTAHNAATRDLRSVSRADASPSSPVFKSSPSPPRPLPTASHVYSISPPLP